MVVCHLARGCKEMDREEAAGDIVIEKLGRHGRVQWCQVLVMGSASLYIELG